MEELNQTGEEYDEYLDIKQITFLMEVDRGVIHQQIRAKELPALNTGWCFLVKLSDLKAYVKKKKSRYDRAVVYASLPEEEKADFWKKSKTVKSNIAEVPQGYLTLQMCAYLLNVTDRWVAQLFEKGELAGKKGFMTEKKHYRKILIQEDSVSAYTQRKLARWDKLEEYFAVEDKFQYWKDATKSFRPSYHK